MGGNRFPIRSWPRKLAAMFKYFPTNYVWNLSVDLAIEMGARIGEIEAMCAPLQEAAKAPDAAGTRAFRETWVRHGRPPVRTGARGRGDAAECCRRARSTAAPASYLITAERLQATRCRAGWRCTNASWKLFARGSALTGERCSAWRSPTKAGISPRCTCAPRPAAGPARARAGAAQRPGLDQGDEAPASACRIGWRGAASHRWCSTSRAPARRCACTA
jgi:hypothetical protein